MERLVKGYLSARDRPADSMLDPAVRSEATSSDLIRGARCALPLMVGVKLPTDPTGGLTIMLATTEPSLAHGSHRLA